MGDHIFELGPKDGRFIRTGGVYVLTRKRWDQTTEALFVGQADVIASAVGPGHPVWRDAVALGLSGLLVVLEDDPDRRRRFAAALESTLSPVLNSRKADRQATLPGVFSKLASPALESVRH